MKIERFIVGPLETNCYIAICEKTHQSLVIDPGDFSYELQKKLREHPPRAILLTHGHFDHIAGVTKIIHGTEIPLLVHSLDAPMLTDPQLNGSYMLGAEITTPEPSGFLEDGENIVFGDSSLHVIHTPGHTSGGVSFVSDGAFVISGDTLFRLSVGRWDLPGGDYDTLIKTLQDKFSIMPDETIVYPGHGETTTIGFEKQHNQFMQND